MLFAFHLNLDSSDVPEMWLATLKLHHSHRSHIMLKLQKFSFWNRYLSGFPLPMHKYCSIWADLWFDEWSARNLLPLTQFLKLYFHSFCTFVQGISENNKFASWAIQALAEFGCIWKTKISRNLSSCQENGAVGAETPELVPHTST